MDWLIDLCESMLLRAVKDLKETADYSQKRARRIGPEVRLWFLRGKDDPRPLSFHNCCYVLGKDPERLLPRLSPWMTPKNPHLADFTNIAGYMTEKDKVSFLSRKIEAMGQPTIRQIQKISFQMMAYNETKALLFAMVARGAVVPIVKYKKRNRMVYYARVGVVYGQGESAEHEEQPTDHDEPRYAATADHQEQVSP